MRTLTTPGTGYRRRQSTTLGGVELQIVTRWEAGPGAWYVDVETSGGVPILSGQRVTPGGYVWQHGQDARLPGALAAIGVDPYRREQLGSAVRVIWLAPGEVLE